MVAYWVIRQKSTCDLRRYLISPQSVMTIFLITPPSCEPKDSILVTTSMPSFTCPNTTCLPSSLLREKTRSEVWMWWDYERQSWDDGWKKSVYHSVLATLMKNWEPLVFGPEFAIESVPAEIERPTSKSILCDAANKILTSFCHWACNI